MPKQSNGSADQQPETLSVREADVRYAGEWVLLQITEWDKYHAPFAGRVIAHGIMRRVKQAFAKLIAATGVRPDAPVYLFAAGALERPWTDGVGEPGARGEP
jgi:hypothetical protein